MTKKRTFNLPTPANRRTHGNKPKVAFRKKEDPFRRLRSSDRWQNLREMFLRREPVCWVCHVRAALEVHHIIEAHLDPTLFWEVSNLAPVCEDCHKQIHSAYRRGISPEIFFPKDRRLECLA